MFVGGGLGIIVLRVDWNPTDMTPGVLLSKLSHTTSSLSTVFNCPLKHFVRTSCCENNIAAWVLAKLPCSLPVAVTGTVK